MCINLSLLTLIKTFVSRLCMPFFSLSWLWKKEQIPLCVCVCKFGQQKTPGSRHHHKTDKRLSLDDAVDGGGGAEDHCNHAGE